MLGRDFCVAIRCIEKTPSSKAITRPVCFAPLKASESDFPPSESILVDDSPYSGKTIRWAFAFPASVQTARIGILAGKLRSGGRRGNIGFGVLK